MSYVITSFKDLFYEIAYSWEPEYNLYRYAEGDFVLNKLYIQNNGASYKTTAWELAKGVFESVETLYNLVHGDTEFKNVMDIVASGYLSNNDIKVSKDTYIFGKTHITPTQIIYEDTQTSISESSYQKIKTFYSLFVSNSERFIVED